MPAVYIIIQRCYSQSFRGVIVYHAGGFTSSFRGAYSQSCRRFCFIMPRGVAILNHAGGLHHHAARVYIIIQRCYSQSFRGVLLYHAAGLIAYQVAGLLSIIPRGYSAGGSALSCRGVIVYHAAGCCYSQSCRRSTSSCRGSTSSCRGSYCLSFRGVIVLAVLLYHSAGCCYSQSCRRSTSSCRRSTSSCRRFCFIIPRCYSLSCRGVLLFSIMPAV